MKLHVTQNKNKSTLRPEGDFTIYGVAEFRDALQKALSTGSDLDIDLSATDEIDAAGLQQLLLAASETASAGKKLRLVAPGESVVETLRLCNLDARFEVAAMLQDAGKNKKRVNKS